MDERRPPSRGSGRLRDLGHLSFFRGMTLPVEGTRGSRSDRRSAQRCPPWGGASAPGAASQRRAAQRAPFLAAAAQPVAQTRRVLSAAWVAAAETPEAGSDAPGVHRGLKIPCTAPCLDPCSGPPGFCPQSW